jgi:predicted glutamine amidotransferase
MCIVGIKPKGIEMNKNIIDVIASTTRSYRCGVGFAYKRSNEQAVHFKKKVNYSYDELYKDIEALNLQANDEIIWHGRAATHGGTTDSNAHPYILGESSKNDLLTTEGTVTADNKNYQGVFMHNGIFNIRSTHNPRLSDTYNYGREILSNLEVIDLIKKDPELYGKMYAKYGWAKLAFLFPDVGVRYTTDNSEWIHDRNLGCIFSNGGYGASKYYDIGGKTVLKTN